MAPVPGLERIEDRETTGPLPPSTSISWDGCVRADLIEPDLLRLTRVTDGARIWLRALRGSPTALLAQADDGAFEQVPETSLRGLSVRFGRSILEAPLDDLEGHRAALERSGLVAAFFAGRPLPGAQLAPPAAPGAP